MALSFRTHPSASALQQLRTFSAAAGAVFLAAAALYTITREQAPAARFEFSAAAEAGAARPEGLQLMLFFADYCFPCEAWEEELTQDPDLWRLIKSHYAPVKVNGQGSSETGLDLAARYGVDRFPTLVVLDSAWRMLDKIDAYLTPADLATRLAAQVAPQAGGQWRSAEQRQARPETRYGLSVASARTYADAKAIAEAQRMQWNRAVWIHPSGTSRYQVLLGPFETREEARITRAFMRVWDDVDAGVEAMAPDPVRYR
ncbi:MAG: thioredoxin fold domain-containing protein [Bacteroidia bacterium]|nr:thioredoxin fold domain-containing protein [Bacteroidia bacterium]